MYKLNGIEMDDAARERAQKAIWEGFDGQTKLLEALYPDVAPIQFGGTGSGTSGGGTDRRSADFQDYNNNGIDDRDE